jgi:hypothetical protein
LSVEDLGDGAYTECQTYICPKKSKGAQMKVKNAFQIGKILSVLYVAFCFLMIFLSLADNSWWILAINLISIPTIISGGLLLSYCHLFYLLTGWSSEIPIGKYYFYVDLVIHIVLNLLILNLLGYLVFRIERKWFSKGESQIC